MLATLAICPIVALWAQTVGPNIDLTKAAGNQNEATVAIDPNDNNRIFVASRNEAGGLYTARSSDGGLSWTTRLIGRATTPVAGDIPRAYGNASAAWDTFGNLFLAYLTQSSVSSGAYVAVSLSQDGGSMFYAPGGGGPVLLLPTSAPGQPVMGDQPTVAVGPGSAGFPGSVWVTYWTKGGIVVSGAGVSGHGGVGPFTTFQPPQPASVNFGDVAIGPKGEVIVTYGPNSAGTGAVYTNAKPDGLGPGAFSDFHLVASVNLGGFTPIPAQPNWGIDPEAGLAVDRSAGPYGGRIYLVYTDAPAAGSTDTNIFVVHSGDLGATWSSPSRVNDDRGANSQFLPHIALDQSTGMIAVTWYDARDAAFNDMARYYGAFSRDGGATFGPNFAIATGISDQTKIPPVANAKKSDYGDYTGSAFVNGRLIPAWADNSNTTGDNPEGATGFDVYTAVVQAPQGTALRPKISDGGVITAGAYGGQAGIAPGTWVEIRGSSLASHVREWSAADFSGSVAATVLDEVRVTVNGKYAAISYISPGQVNIQVPDDIGIGLVPVVVTNHDLSSDPVKVQASTILPGLLAPVAFLANGKQYIVAIAGDGTTFAGLPDGFPGGRPARPGEVVTLYGIGFGPVIPLVPAGTITTLVNKLQNPLSVSFEQTAVDLSAPGTYAGLAPGAVGLYQFSLTVPDVADGAHQLRVTVGGITAQQSLYVATRK